MATGSGAFADSYLGRLRQLIGSRPVLMPGARVIVERADGAVLLIRRGDNRLWGWPSGSAEMGQDIATTARQELLEETGLSAAELVPVGYSSDPEKDRIEYPNGDVLHAFAMIFHVTDWTGEPRPDGTESLDVRWWEPADLPENRTLAVRRSYEALVRFKQTGRFQLI